MAEQGASIIPCFGGASETIRDPYNYQEFVNQSESDTTTNTSELFSRSALHDTNDADSTGTTVACMTSELETLSLKAHERTGLLPRGKTRSSDSDNQPFSTSKIRQRYTALDSTSKRFSDNKPLPVQWFPSNVFNPVSPPQGASLSVSSQNCPNKQICFRNTPGAGSAINETRSELMPQGLYPDLSSNMNMTFDQTVVGSPNHIDSSYVNNVISTHTTGPCLENELYPTSEILKIAEQKLDYLPYVSPLINVKETSDLYEDRQVQDYNVGTCAIREHSNLVSGTDKTSDGGMLREQLPQELINRLWYIINSQTTNEPTQDVTNGLNTYTSSDIFAKQTKSSGSNNSNFSPRPCSRLEQQVNTSDSPSFKGYMQNGQKQPPNTHTPREADNLHLGSTSAQSMVQVTTTNLTDACNPSLSQIAGFARDEFGRVVTSLASETGVSNIASQKDVVLPNTTDIVKIQVKEHIKSDIGNPPIKGISTTACGQSASKTKPIASMAIMDGQQLTSLPIRVDSRINNCKVEFNPGQNHFQSVPNINQLLYSPTGTRIMVHDVRSARPKSVGGYSQMSYQVVPPFECQSIVNRHATGGIPSTNSPSNCCMLSPYPFQPRPLRNSTASNSEAQPRMTFCPMSLSYARRKIAGIPRENLVFQDGDGDTFLHLATCNSNAYQMKAVLERYSREGLLTDVINKRNNLGQTPLYVATVDNQTMSVRELLNYGADPNLMGQCNGMRKIMKAPIHCAAQGGLPFLPTLRELLHSNYLTLDLCTSEGLTALHCAIREHGKTEGGYKKNSELIAEMLIKAGADPNAQDKKSGKTPLMYAIETKDYNLVACMVNIISKDKLRNMLKTQTFDGSNCSKICSGLKMDTEKWKKMNSLLFSTELL